MGIGYQEVDRRVIDYDLWFITPEGPALRGPRLDLGRIDMARTICCIGAAQTFGRFVLDPYPAQLARLLQRPVLNLGVSGAGPEFFLKRPSLMTLLRSAGVVVVQSMSARSVSAGVFRALGNNGMLEFLAGARKGERMLAQSAYGALRAEYGEDAFEEQISAVQSRWLALHEELTGQLEGRRLFLWLSSQRPGENIRLKKSPVGVFPHFVTADMVDAVKPSFDEVVDATFSEMKEQILVNDLTGHVEEVFDATRFPNRPKRLRAINNYYATPEMHDAATRRLLPLLL